ncbi:MAG: hypothetical protein AAFV07_17335 [Bacteroidota bacterium]
MTHRSNAFPAALVSTQLKYLQRAKRKLSTYYVSRCLIPPRAYEQSSSEATAKLKPKPSGRVLDLTCGLGVDTAHFAQTAKEIVSLEPDINLHRVTRYNLDRLGLQHVDLRAQSAEEFVARYNGPPFDLIYVDPSRRGDRNERLHDLADGQPNVVGMMPDLQRLGRQLLIKAAPGYDIQAGIRALPGVEKVSVVSARNECKELWFWVNLQAREILPPVMEVIASRLEGVHQRTLPPVETDWEVALPTLEAGHFILEPDVSYYKAQRLDSWLDDTTRGQHPLGFLWRKAAPRHFPGRVFKVRDVWPYQPKILKRKLREHGIGRANMTRRAFPLTVQAVRQRLRLADGGDTYLLLTTWNGKKVVIWAMPE